MSDLPGLSFAGNPVDPLPVLMERARRLAKKPDQPTDPQQVLDLLAFPLATENFAVPSQFVRLIQPLGDCKWSPLPCTPKYILGAVNLRGRIYSILDIARLIGDAQRPLSKNAHLLLVQGGRLANGQEMELTLLADDLPIALQQPLASLKPPPATLSARAHEYILGVNEVLLIVLDMDRLLSDPAIVVCEEV